MRAISLWQPWASLLIAGVKLYETRHWLLPEWVLNERVAIHAARTTLHMHTAGSEPFRSGLAEAFAADQLVPVDDDLPRGALLGTMAFDACTPTNDLVDALARKRPNELAFGNFDPGRYAWHGTGHQVFREPLPFRGRQQFFTVPDDLLSRPTVPRQRALV